MGAYPNFTSRHLVVRMIKFVDEAFWNSGEANCSVLAASDHTSVGCLSIGQFLRSVCTDAMPKALLPEELSRQPASTKQGERR